MNRVDVLAKVLAEHHLSSGGRNLGQYRTEWTCACGERLTTDGHKGETLKSANDAHVAAALDATLAAQEGERGGAEVAEERDMYRDKAHGFIRLASQYDRALGELTSRIEDLIAKGERRSTMVIGVSELRAALSIALGADAATAPAPRADTYQPQAADIEALPAALADRAGALATHDAEVWDAGHRHGLLYPDGSWPSPDNPYRADRIEAQS